MNKNTPMNHNIIYKTNILCISGAFEVRCSAECMGNIKSCCYVSDLVTCTGGQEICSVSGTVANHGCHHRIDAIDIKKH